MSKKEERWEFKVSLVPPPGATKSETREYIEDAVATMKGSLRPDGADADFGFGSRGDPLFYLDGDKVKASIIRKKPALAKSKNSA